MERRIFRQVALERLSSPEQLDHLLAVAPPRSWAALVAVLLLLIAGLAWGATARIATTAAARGVLLRDGQSQAPRAAAYLPRGAAAVRPGMPAVLECGQRRLAGTVAAVAPLPAGSQAAPRQPEPIPGRDQLIAALDPAAPNLELLIDLEQPADAPAGALCSVRITVDERAPLDWLGRR